MAGDPMITCPNMCQLHQSLLVRQCGFKPSDPWRVLMVMTQIALFQGATADPETHRRTGGDVTRIPELGCLACWKPDRFGEIVDAARTKGMSAIKPLGESWVKAAGTGLTMETKNDGDR